MMRHYYHNISFFSTKGQKEAFKEYLQKEFIPQIRTENSSIDYVREVFSASEKEEDTVTIALAICYREIEILEQHTAQVTESLRQVISQFQNQVMVHSTLMADLL